jgi:uncharacterized protein involved in exopolysaccharide biosynthesis
MIPGNDLVPQPPVGAGGLQAQQRPSDQGEPIRFRYIWGMIRRNLWIILAMAALCVAAATYLTRGLVPKYSASASVRIDPRENELPVLDVLRSTPGNEVKTEMGMHLSCSGC